MTPHDGQLASEVVSMQTHLSEHEDLGIDDAVLVG